MTNIQTTILSSCNLYVVKMCVYSGCRSTTHPVVASRGGRILAIPVALVVVPSALGELSLHAPVLQQHNSPIHSVPLHQRLQGFPKRFTHIEICSAFNRTCCKTFGSHVVSCYKSSGQALCAKTEDIGWEMI